jgi:NAD(P)-dependent dehydrogenase (short-subunit alcohol dehydrogenase family)
VSTANRHAVVTGGAGEIGLAIARRLSEKGAAITLLDKNISPKVAIEVEKLGFRFVASDVTDSTSVNEAVNSLPPIDIAVANAGVHRGGRALDLSPADWFLMLSVNATGVFLFAQAAARRMVQAGRGGSIVVTGVGFRMCRMWTTPAIAPPRRLRRWSHAAWRWSLASIA